MTDGEFPADMSPWLKHRLHRDVRVYGTALYEEMDGGYERVAPEEYMNVCDSPNDVEMVRDQSPPAYYGTPHIRQTAARIQAMRRFERLFSE